MQDSWIPTFEKRTRRSKKAFDRAVKVSPGGVQSAPRFHNPYPIYMKGEMDLEYMMWMETNTLTTT